LGNFGRIGSLVRPAVSRYWVLSLQGKSTSKKPQPLTAAIIAYMKTGKERVDVFRVMSLIY